MMPRTESRLGPDGYVPLDTRYERVMQLIGADGDPEKKEGKFKKYREELFGPQVIAGAPDLYWDVKFMLDYGSAEEWERLDLHTKAKIRAAKQIDGMVDVLARHDQLQEEKLKKLNSDRSNA